VIATHVNATILLHRGLEIRGEDVTADTKNNASQAKDIGNVTKESGVTFQYAVRKDINKEEFKNLKVMPFQVQIHFRRLNGMKCLRVITKSQQLTFDRKVAEENANIAVLGMNAVQQSAHLASKGKYSEARVYNLGNKKMLSRAAHTSEQQQQYTKWFSTGKKFEEELSKVQHTEVQDLGVDLDDMDEEEAVVKEEKEKDKDAPKKKVGFDKKAKANQVRKNNRTDSTANMLYQMKSMHSNQFK